MTVLLAESSLQQQTVTCLAKKRQKKPSPPLKMASKKATNNTSSTLSLHVLSQEHRHAISKLVTAAKLSEDFWSYYRSGRGRLTVPPPVSLSTETPNKSRSVLSAHFDAVTGDATCDDLETVNQFLIFLNALRLFSFFQLASQLESVVLPDRCIRVSPSGSLRRRGELQLCIGISRLRLPFTNKSGVVTHHWIRCCRFRPPSNSQQSVQNDSNEQQQAILESPIDMHDQKKPLLQQVDDGVECSDVNVGMTPSPVPLLAESSTTNNAVTSKLRETPTGVGVGKKHPRKLASGSNNIKKKKDFDKSPSLFRRFLACFCFSLPAAKAVGHGDMASLGELDERDELISPSFSRPKSYNGDVPLLSNKKPVLDEKQQLPSPLQRPIAIQVEDSTSFSVPSSPLLSSSDSAVLTAVHEHFNKTCSDESAELSEFIEKTIGALFFDVHSGEADKLGDYDDCCGLESGPDTLAASHVSVSICFTAAFQVAKLERCLGDRSFISAVKKIVFPYVYRPASSSFLSASLSSSGPASPAPTTNTDGDSCHGASVTSPSMASSTKKITDADDDAASPLLTISPSDVELFVVVRQNHLRSVVNDLQPPVVSPSVILNNNDTPATTSPTSTTNVPSSA